MARFDFISDDGFRASLDSDYAEIEACISSTKAWKAVHVLAGSVIEAVLVDYLFASGYQERTGTDPLKMQLADAIAACKAEKVLSNRAAELSSVVRSYRNLIHPGRVIRLGETVDEKTALIAKALVDIVIDEVAAGKKQTYGYTAEQILAKLENDGSSLPILNHLLKETNEFERLRLVLDVIPERHFLLRDEMFYEGERLEKGFRQVFQTLDEKKQEQVARRFVSILKEETGEKVLSYEITFFRADDMRYLRPAEQEMIKEHLLSRLAGEVTPQLLTAMNHIGKYVHADSISRLIDPPVRTMFNSRNELHKKAARDFLVSEYWWLSEEAQKKAKDRMEAWRKAFEDKSTTERAEAIMAIVQAWEAEIPF